MKIFVVEIDGCSPSPCHISVQCTDVMWMDLSPLDPENLAVCGECPAGLRGDGVNCFGEFLTLVAPMIVSCAILTSQLTF